MTNNNGNGDDIANAEAENLARAEFLAQINNLEGNLLKITEHLKVLGEHSTKRLEESENIAAHLLAVEAVLTVLVRTHPIAAEDVLALVRVRTSAHSGDPEGSPGVRAIVDDILGGAGTG